MRSSYLGVFLLLLSACASDQKYNLPDIEDTNRIPAEYENREDEIINLPDDQDGNRTPDELEERENEEERIRVIDEPLF